ncbi:hypothetical protein BO94DRAFT_563439 [Aspergillus sclerotioniger CBS 115572]|uniref:Aminoglycoside phosphotransferase domain-containing protein n=1 Tax=Aspergillus sclerotioniger CBS 115572 TaxID=1450535 RepID=A0A317XBF7_9EURO|nr:hypothetical protein BO94DRAFT_563439 [Aspergillus sclerotioniger CBS 115572]PWY93880.1 hypothetical protein BO94DRAFT_563439 [Aspergillus sclerotioniger CBS 115572]
MNSVHLSTVDSKPPDTCPSGSDEKPDPLFSYTSGRWLWDEASQLLQRYRSFNVDELKKAAARSVNARSCVKLIKFNEDGYYKTFLLTMDNGVEVFAKLPNPLVPEKVATASEVATLDFLRNELDIPVPRVFAWSSSKDQPVGVEYIIMEKPPGQELTNVWPTMDLSHRMDIVAQLVSIQAKIATVDLHSYGSLYYRKDIEDGLDVPGLVDRFCIGPSYEARFWEEERRSMDYYRGPWISSEAYVKDIARREREWILRFAKPHQLEDPQRQPYTQESPRWHAELLDRYLKMVSNLMPPHKGLHRSVLWHPDLQDSNIFVEQNRIVSIIGWQGGSSLPIYYACEVPRFLQIDITSSLNLILTARLTSQERKESRRRNPLTQLQEFYISKFQELDNDVFSALSFPQALTRQRLIHSAGYTWEDDGLIVFLELQQQARREWTELTGLPLSSCPVRSDENKEFPHCNDRNSLAGRRVVFHLLGIPRDGWVHRKDFEAKVEVMRNLAGSIIKSATDKDDAKRALRSWKLSESGPASLSGNQMVF